MNAMLTIEQNPLTFGTQCAIMNTLCAERKVNLWQFRKTD